jgi:hypothetical protein
MVPEMRKLTEQAACLTSPEKQPHRKSQSIFDIKFIDELRQLIRHGMG